MLKYLLVILDKGAVPFCYYTNAAHHASALPGLMPLELLQSVVRYAERHELLLNFLCGNHKLPDAYEQLIDTVSHIKLVPLCLCDTYEDGVLVLEADEAAGFGALQESSERTIILRVGQSDLPRLADCCETLQGKYKRLNIHLVGLERYGQAQLDAYKAQLQILAGKLRQRYQARQEIEINVLSDRLLLSQMNNCDAGIQHLTIAPDGKVYLCPAFYHEGEAGAVDVFSSESEPVVRNRQLLELAHAPICSRCNAYQCKRCVYLNVSTTAEINTPSREQCLISHMERDVSRQLLHTLKKIEPFDRMAPIAGLNYRDPFEWIMRSDRMGCREPAATVPESLDDNAYLVQIYEMQKKILEKLGDE